MYPIFKNKELEEAITQKGYVVAAQLIPDTTCNDLIHFFNEQGVVDNRAFTISNWNNNLPYREAVFNKICALVEPFSKTILNDYKPVLGVFTAKQPMAESQMLLHQDWSLVDETKYRSVSIWVALCDMDKVNGNLQVAEYSHIYADQPRGMNMPIPFEALRQEMHNRHLTDLPLKKGDAIIFEHRLVHASPANHSAAIRLAAVLALIPSEAPLIHFYKDPDNEREIEVLEMSEADFRQIDFFDVPNKPKHTGSLGKQPITFRQITTEEITQLTQQTPA
jgi:ectoine hydroxylase-related dioxygenase (phytanoyl-CoA dioxygenase family)